jgi:GDP-L-fucose synthase
MKKSRIFIAGHKGMVGSALVRILQKQDVDLIIKEKKELNLLNQNDVQNFFKNENIDQVYLSAAKVGGINANNIYPAEFIYENLTIQTNIIHSAFLNDVKKLLFLGSSCIYPKNAKQPMQEEELLTGKLEPTNEPYAIAKIAGIKICDSYNRQYGKSHRIDYRSVMPTNLYGIGDNYHAENSHVIPGLINRFHHAKINNELSVSIWGSGTPKREFLFVGDMANACIHIMNFDRDKYHSCIKPNSHINIGSGEEITIKELALNIKNVVGYKGKINFDTSKPDGSPRKLIDSHRLNKLGWQPEVNLKVGLIKTYEDYLKS